MPAKKSPGPSVKDDELYEQLRDQALRADDTLRTT
jgi:hypothetical protein